MFRHHPPNRLPRKEKLSSAEPRELHRHNPYLSKITLSQTEPDRRFFGMTSNQWWLKNHQKLVLALAFGVFVDAAAFTLLFTGYYTFFQTDVYGAYVLLALLAALSALEIWAVHPKNTLKPAIDPEKAKAATQQSSPSYFYATVAFNVAMVVALAAFSMISAMYQTIQYPADFPYLFTAIMMTYLVSFVLLVFVASGGTRNQPRKRLP
jgi:hypothetical protein